MYICIMIGILFIFITFALIDEHKSFHQWKLDYLCKKINIACKKNNMYLCMKYLKKFIIFCDFAEIKDFLQDNYSNESEEFNERLNTLIKSFGYDDINNVIDHLK